MNEFLIAAKDAGIRIDRFLAARIPSDSRTSIRKWLEQNYVLVNGHPAKASYKLRIGDCIEMRPIPAPVEEKPLLAWDHPLQVLYEDDWLVAIYKPAGMIVHPGAGTKDHTVVHAALRLVPQIRSVGHPARPGVVHRLDKETSGVLLIAKTQESYLKLAAMFKDRKIEKRYRALAFGKFEHSSGRIEKALGRDPSDRKKISIRATRKRQAITLYRVLKAYGFGSLLDVQILTGRTHQIRVHLSSENHPIVGDAKYGGGNWNRIANVDLRNRLKASEFFGLHAFSLDFKHPITGEPLHIQAELPPIWNEMGRVD
jgi:23S rRNA pseudouridine1911/1915/1917 synthase